MVEDRGGNGMKFNVTVTAIGGDNKQVTRNGNVKFEQVSNGEDVYRVTAEGLTDKPFEQGFSLFDLRPGDEMQYIVAFCEIWFDGTDGHPKMTGIKVERVAADR